MTVGGAYNTQHKQVSHTLILYEPCIASGTASRRKDFSFGTAFCTKLPTNYFLTYALLTVLRLTSINVGAVKMFIITINVTLPELETIVTVTNSLYSTVL